MAELANFGLAVRNLSRGPGVNLNDCQVRQLTYETGMTSTWLHEVQIAPALFSLDQQMVILEASYFK